VGEVEGKSGDVAAAATSPVSVGKVQQVFGSVTN
jgi:hypothetical protein